MAEHIQIDYGSGVLEKEMKTLPSYIVVTMEIPWRLCDKFFKVNPPKQVVMVDSLDKSKLDELSTLLPQHVEIVGLGGGTAIDAAKYFAYLQNTTPVLVPTISSTNAPFSDFISIRKNGSAFGFKVDEYPKRLIIDYKALTLSDWRYNRAGYGDLLYMQTTLNDWLIASQNEQLYAIDVEVQHEIEEIMDKIIKKATEIGAMTKEGLYILMENTRLSTELYMDHPHTPISAGSEHLFAWNLEMVTNKTYIHGEIVALGIVITSYLQQIFITNSYFQRLRHALDEAQVTYHPVDIGISWEEIKKALLTVNDYNNEFRHFYTVFNYVDWSTDILEGLREYLYSER
ncbi:iron-containing alcohol dehydrogenase [Gracilibacillus sp. D59]|uniref:iron-containing alcohol dehydrogenase n=1 Tax=Gracilibacillus sp. D59 TaxID=3457434 RepID=UPI003FCE4757